MKKVILIADAVFIGLMILWPPMLQHQYLGSTRLYNIIEFAGYHFINWSGNNGSSGFGFVQIDTTRLAFQILGVLVVSGLLIIAFPGSSKSSKTEEVNYREV